MNLARVVSLKDNVEVILKKKIDDGKHSIEVTYIAEVEEQLFNTSFIVAYKTKRTRDEEFLKLDKGMLTYKGEYLPEPFKSELNGSKED